MGMIWLVACGPLSIELSVRGQRWHRYTGRDVCCCPKLLSACPTHSAVWLQFLVEPEVVISCRYHLSFITDGAGRGVDYDPGSPGTWLRGPFKVRYVL